MPGMPPLATKHFYFTGPLVEKSVMIDKQKEAIRAHWSSWLGYSPFTRKIRVRIPDGPICLAGKDTRENARDPGSNPGWSVRSGLERWFSFGVQKLRRGDPLLRSSPRICRSMRPLCRVPNEISYASMRYSRRWAQTKYLYTTAGELAEQMQASDPHTVRRQVTVQVRGGSEPPRQVGINIYTDRGTVSDEELLFRLVRAWSRPGWESDVQPGSFICGHLTRDTAATYDQ
eukprot:g70322.t1